MSKVLDGVAWLGLPGCLGLLLLGGVAWAEWHLLPAWHGEAEQAAEQTVALRRKLHVLTEPTVAAASASAASGVAPPSEPEAAWSLLWQALPTEAQRAALQNQVLQAATRQGLEIDAVQYRGERVPLSSDGDGLWRQRMVMPVQGPYPAVRRWLTEIERLPSAGVDALSLERKDPGTDEVQAQVSVSLWWRQGRQP
ncbi:MAG: hypothetical protein ACK4MG_00435 [Aquabacterium sp.]